MISSIHQLTLALVDAQMTATLNAVIDAHNTDVAAFGQRTYCGRVYGAADIARQPGRVALT